jgi:simple sugar transport system permease protein
MNEKVVKDERVAQTGTITKLMRRPELGALLGAVVIFAGFGYFDRTGIFLTLDGTARWTDYAAPYGIMAIFVALLMIGGEFDLSAGVMVGSSGLVMGMMINEFGMNIWMAIAVAIVFAGLVGFINGILVIRTGLPSFIITLAMFFVLQGSNLAITKLVTDTVKVAGVNKAEGFETAKVFFASEFSDYKFNVSILWWIALMIVATWLLTRTTFGNWIFAVGGDANAARNAGVPVARTKIILFMMTSLAACLVGVMYILTLGSVQAGQGVGNEFIYIIAAVVGGTLLTGGAGSAIGASIGAAIIGIAFIGIPYAGWNSDWNYTFLGVILFVAVMINNYISKRAKGAKK